MNPVEICATLSEQLGVRLWVSQAQTPCPTDCLTTGEQHLLRSMGSSRRQSSWLIGRHALKKLLPQMNLPTDTSELIFPHPRLSLTHSDALAFAIGLSPETSEIAGLGIDYERFRPVRDRALRMFLTAPEQEWIRQQPTPGGEVIRLWTVKESLLKADQDNADRQYRFYQVDDPAQLNGNAICLVSGKLAFQYASYRLNTGFLSVSISRPAITPSQQTP